jgi:hypothetical protein
MPRLEPNGVQKRGAVQPIAYESSTPETPLAYRAVRGGLWVAVSSYWTICPSGKG